MIHFSTIEDLPEGHRQKIVWREAENMSVRIGLLVLTAQGAFRLYRKNRVWFDELRTSNWSNAEKKARRLLERVT